MDRNQRIGIAAALFLFSIVVIALLASNGTFGELLGSELNQAGIIADTGGDPEVMSRYVNDVGILPILVGDYSNLDIRDYRPGITSSAEASIEEIEQLASDLALAQANIAKSLGERGFAEEGLPWIEDALLTDPDLPEAHLVSGFLNFRLRNGNEAIRDFRKVLMLDPENYLAYLYLGQIYNGRENPEQSLRYLDKANELAYTLEERSEALTHRAVAYSLLWRYDDAFADLDLAETLDADNGWAIIVRSVIENTITMRQGLIPDNLEVEEEGGSKQKLDFGD
jgi:tetratricopeptide (TPR) repeat protein